MNPSNTLENLVPVELLSGDEQPRREVIAVDTAFLLLSGVRTYGTLTWMGCLRRACGYAECRIQQAEVKARTAEEIEGLEERGLITVRRELSGKIDKATGKPLTKIHSIAYALKRYTRPTGLKIGEKEYDGDHTPRGTGKSSFHS